MSARAAALIASLSHDFAPPPTPAPAASPEPTAGFLSELRRAGLLWRAAALLLVHALETSLFLLSWVAIGHGLLSGRLDTGWLTAWALCLASIVPLRLVSVWWQGVLSIGAGGLIKQRLLAGALTLDADWMRRKGAGQLLGEVIESGTLETLAASGGLVTLLALVETAAVLVIFGPSLDALVFLAWLALFLALAFFNLLERDRWTRWRLEITHRLVERMTGHRTRLAQQPPEEWHTAEDLECHRYLQLSEPLDRTNAALAAALPRGYLIVATLALLPAFLAGAVPATALAIRLGGILFASLALSRLAFGLTRLSSAWVAWSSVREMFAAASRPPRPGVASASPGVETVATVQDLVFTHQSRTEPILKGCNLEIRRGDFLLLEGGSGSGKSTLASLLAGLRRPSSGLILVAGLDRQTLGDLAWRSAIVTVPQYHENHLLSASLEFNLLLGRPYPFTPEDHQRALAVCHELGLTPLLERMPGGLRQMVGESGWQLSQGERSRVFLARALLQGGDLLLLDESFAALDPDTLRLSLDCVFRRASTLLVIAHP